MHALILIFMHHIFEPSKEQMETEFLYRVLSFSNYSSSIILAASKKDNTGMQIAAGLFCNFKYADSVILILVLPRGLYCLIERLITAHINFGL